VTAQSILFYFIFLIQRAGGTIQWQLELVSGPETKGGSRRNINLETWVEKGETSFRQARGATGSLVEGKAQALRGAECSLFLQLCSEIPPFIPNCYFTCLQLLLHQPTIL
jgi:hypothetical protein